MEVATKNDVREIMKELIQTDIRPMMYEVAEEVTERIVIAAFKDYSKVVRAGFEEVADQFTMVFERFDRVEARLEVVETTMVELDRSVRQNARITREHSADIAEIKARS